MERKHYTLGAILIVFHLIGAIGTVLPTWKELTLSLTPFNLLLSTALILYAHQGSVKELFVFLALSYSSGLLIEMIGTNTGLPFGIYTYGSTLGIELFNTPVIIGLNWFLLSYISAALTRSLKMTPAVKIVLAALGMVLLDVLIEPVAIQLDYWSWQGQSIPISNYVAWFVMGLILQFAQMRILKTLQNPLALSLLIAQLLYFLIVLFLL